MSETSYAMPELSYTLMVFNQAMSELSYAMFELCYVGVKFYHF